LQRQAAFTRCTFWLTQSGAWLDRVNVPYRGSVDVILDLTDPAIKGLSVFHCHLLHHKDKGMMAKVLVQEATQLVLRRVSI
jgi:FtsP/CotA-like multicopper oxidase with cupredoxin domain